jgi:hypothetical protein
MAFAAFGGAESDDGFGGGFRRVSAAAGAAVVAAPGAFPGTYSYEIDPVNGAPVTEVYGWRAGLSTPNLLTVLFMYRYAADFDASISIAELGKSAAGGAFARRLAQDDLEKLSLIDADEDAIVNTAANYVTANQDYWMLWYTDLRTPTRDILWVWKAGAWDKAWDIANWGDGDPANIDRITFGTSVGKGLPTTGGPFYVDEVAVQVLNEAPNTNPIGSVTTRLKMPSANGTDGDFNAGDDDGGGWGNPDYRNVDEIPHDGNTTYDEGDVQGDKQSYAIADADGGDTPLALQIVGAAEQGGIFEGPIDARVYIYDGSSRDYSAETTFVLGYTNLAPVITYNLVNGTLITEALFNTLEAGIEITSLSGSSVLRLTHLGLEYIIEGPKALPYDFPHLRTGVAPGSANVGSY